MSDKVDFNSMSIPQLKKYAKTNSLTLPENLTEKPDIINAIEAAQIAQVPPGDNDSEQTADTPPAEGAGGEETTEATNAQPADEKPPQGENEATGGAPPPNDNPSGAENKPLNPDAQKPPDDPDGSAAFVIGRILKVTKPLMQGYDVAAVQDALIVQGIHCGIDGASGVYNASTAYAVRLFQAQNRLIVTGKVDSFTARALGAEWKNPESEE